jgi:NADH:ubiquinone oxidoreductase subunit 3 (subunit A)
MKCIIPDVYIDGGHNYPVYCMAENEILNPVVVFLVYLGVGMLVYLAGKALAPPLKDSGWKLMSYACGEAAPLGKLRPNYNFYHIAYLFTILHVGALVTCTSFGITTYILPVIYLSLVLFGMFILIAR